MGLNSVNKNDLYKRWSKDFEQGLIDISLLELIKLIKKHMDAQQVLIDAYNNLPSDFADKTCYFGEHYDPDFADAWDAVIQMINPYGSTHADFLQNPVFVSYPNLSFNRGREGWSSFPLSIWKKQIAKMHSDAKKLNKAIKQASA